MGQTEGKQVPHQNATDPAETPPTSPNLPTPSSTQPQQNNSNTNSNLNTSTPPKDDWGVGAIKNNSAEVLKRSTDELVGGINKLGANILSTAKSVPYTSYSVNAFKKAATTVEDAIVTVKSYTAKVEEEPELESVAKMALFFPLIRTSVPISDLAKGLPMQKTNIAYLDPKHILLSLVDYQRFLTVTSKMVSARQMELNNKIKDVEMSSGRKAVFTLAMNVTDIRHFNTQFSEVGRFHSNLEKTKQSIKDILGMFDKLNALLPPGEQLESFSAFAASNPTISSPHSSQKFSVVSSHSSINYASLNLPKTPQSSGSFAALSSPSHPSTSFSSSSQSSSGFSSSSGKFSTFSPPPPPSHSSMKFSAPSSNSKSNTTSETNTNTHTTKNTTNISTTNTNTNANITTNNTNNISHLTNNDNSNSTDTETTESENTETENSRTTDPDTTVPTYQEGESS